MLLFKLVIQSILIWRDFLAKTTQNFLYFPKNTHLLIINFNILVAWHNFHFQTIFIFQFYFITIYRKTNCDFFYIICPFGYNLFSKSCIGIFLLTLPHSIITNMENWTFQVILEKCLQVGRGLLLQAFPFTFS